LDTLQHNYAFARAQPYLILHSPANQWRALAAWDLGFLGKALEAQNTQLGVQTSAQPHFM
jgi:hypothetical protein